MFFNCKKQLKAEIDDMIQKLCGLNEEQIMELLSQSELIGG